MVTQKENCVKGNYAIFADQQQRSQCTTSVIVNSFRGITRPKTFSTRATSFLEHTFVSGKETLLSILLFKDIAKPESLQLLVEKHEKTINDALLYISWTQLIAVRDRILIKRDGLDLRLLTSFCLLGNNDI